MGDTTPSSPTPPEDLTSDLRQPSYNQRGQRSSTETPTTFYSGLIRRGIDRAEALRLTASVYGLPVQEDGTTINWKLSDINNLLFTAERLRSIER